MENNEIKKLDMSTANIIEKNILKIREIFPNAIINGKVDFEVLKQELSNVLLDEKKEKYQLTWPGKSKAILNANNRINKTLRPLIDRSSDFDNTKNIYIEGDNLEVLKTLQESYLRKINVIYIDPPYNTGRNLIYKNDYSREEEIELKESGQLQDNGNKMVVNTDSNGRFHSDWLSMMFSRLKLARNLLADDGVIFIAIDDNEEANVQKMADEIFGERSFVGKIVTRCNPQGRGKNNIDPCHEYHLVYAKNFDRMNNLRLAKNTSDSSYKNFMRSGTNSRKNERPKRFYPMLVKDNVVSCIENSEYNKIYNETTNTFDEKFIQELTKKYEDLGFNVVWPIAQNGEEKVWQRVFERASVECSTYIYQGKQIKTPDTEDRTPMSLWTEEKYSNVAYGTNQLNALFDNHKVFDYSKSIYTVMDLISLTKNDIVLDFFSGSATTAEAVMRLNAGDNGNRKFILVQIPEKCDESTDAFKLGFKTICDVGEERIRRSAEKIKAETNANIDYGFRVYRIDTSNMKDVFYEPTKLNQTQLNMFESNIKEDRTSEDLLTQVILDLGLTLDLSIEERNILNNKVYFVAGNSLVACFDNQINIDILNQICEVKPLKVVFRESSFRNDSDKINAYERIKKLSPETEISVL